MEETKSWEFITARGEAITNYWNEVGGSLGLNLKTAGLSALTSFSIDSPNWLKYKTFITQEMLKQGILAGNSVYVCLAHTDKVIEQYKIALEPIMQKIVDFEAGKEEIDKYLEGPVCHGGFKRLN